MDWQRFPEDIFAHLPAALRIVETLRLHERAIEAATTEITISDCRLPDMPLIFTNTAFVSSLFPKGRKLLHSEKGVALPYANLCRCAGTG